MKFILMAFALVSSLAHAETEILKISSDQASYSVGDNAILRAMLLTKPDNKNLEFEVFGSLNGDNLPVERITEFENFSTVQNLAAGAYTWSVEVYIQDARMARDLKESLSFYATKIAAIDAELAANPTPEREAELLAEKTRYQGLASVTESQLAGIRTKVHGPVTLTFQAE